MAAKRLSGIRYAPQWISHLGALKGCLDYLEIDCSLGWLYGVSGHAFVLNVHGELCPSGPTAWGDGRCLNLLAQNVGCRLQTESAFRGHDGFAEARQRAFEMVRAAIDDGYPCFAWELAIPEYAVITGYDEVGYYHHGPMSDKGPNPTPWDALGSSDIGWLEATAVRPGKAPDDLYAVRAALEFAFEFATEPPKWIHEGYRGGLAGFDVWISALGEELADGHGLAYNAACWHECREQATAFLSEARARLDGVLGPSLDQAIAAYDAVAGALQVVAQQYPFIGREPEHLSDLARREKAIEALQTAKRAEEMGLQALSDTLTRL